MSRLTDMRVATRLAVSFVAILIITLALGVLSVTRLNAVSAKSAEITGKWLPTITSLSATQVAQWTMRTAQFREVVSPTEEELHRYISTVAERYALYQEERRKGAALIEGDEARALWAKYEQQWQLYADLSTKLDKLMLAGDKEQAQKLVYGQGREYFNASADTLQALIKLLVARSNTASSDAAALTLSARTLIIGMIVLAVVLGVAISMWTGRSISGPIASVVEIFKSIASGNLDNRIETSRGDEIGHLLVGLSGMQTNLKAQIESERAQAAENSRIRQALDKVSTSVLLADADHRVIYVNETAQSTFERAQSQIRVTLPEFDASRLRGSSLDGLATNPTGQRQALTSLRATLAEERKLGGCTFRVVSNPVTSVNGERIGTVMEWTDRTQEVGVENEMRGMLDAVVGGDLSRRISLAGKSGFFEAMTRGVNSLIDNLAEIVAKVKSVSGEVYRGAEEISSGNENLSHRSQQQSASLEETASSMEEMTVTVKQNADNAAQANQLATAARDLADKGGAVVSKAVGAMSSISTSSRKIADIISVIDEIAFQTNLLALNAAVEAARAGEQGRGFAVVASEVRGLAGRSATAAKEIKALIVESVKEVDDGSGLVTQSGATLDQIVIAVKKVSDIVAEIAAASREQSAGIEQVNQAVSQMDEMTQHSAALVEQASAASRAMADQARDLNHLMERYRVSSSVHESATAAFTADNGRGVRSEGRVHHIARAKFA